MVKYFFRSFVVLAIIALVPQPLRAVGYTYTDFALSDFGIAGAADTVLIGNNNSGRVVGLYHNDFNPVQALTPGTKAFVSDSNGQNFLQLHPHAAATAAEADAINNFGVVVGTYAIGSGLSEGFLGFAYDNGVYTTIDVRDGGPAFADASDTIVSNIDDNGVIVGSWSQDFTISGLETVRSSGFRASPNGSGGYSYEDVDLGGVTKPLSNTFLNGRNASGKEIATFRDQVIDTSTCDFPFLTCEVNDQVNGTLLNDTTIKYPEAGATRVSDLNDPGIIVGVATFAEEVAEDDFEFTNVAYSVKVSDLESLSPDDVVYTDLRIPGHLNSYGQTVVEGELPILDPTGHSGVNSINNNGVLVGFYDTDDGVYRGFVGRLAAGIVGDYNSDGAVDAADYVLWRNNVGGDGSALANRAVGNNGPIGTADYNTWKSNFGQSNAAGSLAAQPNAAVPEPAAWVSLAVALVLCGSIQPSKRTGTTKS